MTKAIAYLRTSSITNVGPDKDSDARQRDAIAAYAARSGIEVVAEFYDAAVKGTEPVTARPGFAAMLERIAGNGVRMILVESASRFARDLIVQETGYSYLKKLGIVLVAVDDPDAFTADTPTARLVRQVLGAVAEFEKANLVAKMKRARDKASDRKGRRVEGQKGYRDTNPELVALAKSLWQGRTLQATADELTKLGYVTRNGLPFAPAQIKRLVEVV
jgi:DNA invertase Pin-like site-specific DNA recombinase